MHAVFREAKYPADLAIEQTPQFQEFHKTHAARPGYVGTVVAHLDEARYLQVTLWQTEKDMHAAREALTPVVERLLNPLMRAPSVLLGTGRVVFTDVPAPRAH
jgi:hypothetical protein